MYKSAELLAFENARRVAELEAERARDGRRRPRKGEIAVVTSITKMVNMLDNTEEIIEHKTMIPKELLRDTEQLIAVINHQAKIMEGLAASTAENHKKLNYELAPPQKP